MTASLSPQTGQLPAPIVPPLQNGDRLTRDEFERRYAAMPRVKKAELVEGVVYMPSPVSTENHASPHFDLASVLGAYRMATPGVQGGDNGTVRLDLDNEPQPDLFLRIAEDCGGQSRIEEGYVVGAPELIAEIAASSASYDLHDKLNAYRRNGVREYVVWRVLEQEIDWFILREGRFERLSVIGGQFHSQVFPGLWLDPVALVKRQLSQVAEVIQSGLSSDEHQHFIARLSPK
jgi:Uma2 family endonuclease